METSCKLEHASVTSKWSVLLLISTVIDSYAFIFLLTDKYKLLLASNFIISLVQHLLLQTLFLYHANLFWTIIDYLPSRQIHVKSYCVLCLGTN